MNNLSDAILNRIMGFLSPIDRLKMQISCKRFQDSNLAWNDIIAIDVRSDVYTYGDFQQKRPFQLVSSSVTSKILYHIKLINKDGKVFRLRNTIEKFGNKSMEVMFLRLTSLVEITIWDCALGEEFNGVLCCLNTLKTLRIWNSSKYFDKKSPAKRLLNTLFSRPNLSTIFILDSCDQINVSYKVAFPRSIVEYIKGPVANFQLTGLYISWRTFDALCNKLSGSLKRLAIGCTYGKNSRRDRYIRALEKLEKLEDIDIPPYVFHLGDSVEIDKRIQRLFQTLPLISLGFRHYNSASLFQYIEFQLPQNIRLLRIHHNKNRIPNFAQLGQPQLEYKSVSRKTSWLSSRQTCMGSSSSYNSIASGTNDDCSVHRRSSCASNGSITSQTTAQSERKNSNISLQFRNLTIFAIQETVRRSMIENISKIDRRYYAGVQIFYIKESLNNQEMLGRMASPMHSPYVYSKSNKREVRIIKGDLVRPIPLSSLGMESDYEMSDWEDNF